MYLGVFGVFRLIIHQILIHYNNNLQGLFKNESSKNPLKKYYNTKMTSIKEQCPKILTSVYWSGLRTKPADVIIENRKKFIESYPNIRSRKWNKKPKTLLEEKVSSLPFYDLDHPEYYATPTEWILVISNYESIADPKILQAGFKQTNALYRTDAISYILTIPR